MKQIRRLRAKRLRSTRPEAGAGAHPSYSQSEVQLDRLLTRIDTILDEVGAGPR